MGQTLFDRLINGKKVPEKELYNPLQAEIGNLFRIDVLKLRNMPPRKLKGVIEYTRTEAGNSHQFCDYLFYPDKVIPETKLRLNPKPNPDDGMPYDCLLLTHDCKEGWVPELDAALRDTTGKFEVTDPTGVKKYLRLPPADRSGRPYAADVKTLIDLNGDDKIQVNEIKLSKVEYFDFYRECQDEAGQPYHEFLFVDFDPLYKTFNFWVGVMVAPQLVTCL